MVIRRTVRNVIPDIHAGLNIGLNIVNGNCIDIITVSILHGFSIVHLTNVRPLWLSRNLAFVLAVIDGRVVTDPDVVRREAVRAFRIVASDDYDTFGALDMMRTAPCAPVGADGEQQQR